MLGSFGSYILLGLIALLIDLGNLGVDVGLWRRSGSSIRGRRWLCLGRRRSWRQSTLALLGLQILETLVDGLAHVVLHLLQVGQLHGDGAGFRALDSPLLASTTRLAVVASEAAGPATAVRRRQ